MSEPFLAEIKMIGFEFAPRGWAHCDGELLSINQNPALFSLLGTRYGGDGEVSFALPDLQGRTPIHRSDSHVPGTAGGVEAVALAAAEVATHTHLVRTSAAAGTERHPAARAMRDASGSYRQPPAAALTASKSEPGASIGEEAEPHNNLQPYLTIAFVIAIQGIMP